jgi:hypothetical protein
MHSDFDWLLGAYSHPTVPVDLRLRLFAVGEGLLRPEISLCDERRAKDRGSASPLCRSMALSLRNR